MDQIQETMVGLFGQMGEAWWSALRQGMCEEEQSRSVGKTMVKSS